jgi:hypothetical protein
MKSGDHGLGQRFGHVADAEADDLLVRVGLLKGVHAPGDVGEKIGGFQLQIIFIDADHMWSSLVCFRCCVEARPVTSKASQFKSDPLAPEAPTQHIGEKPCLADAQSHARPHVQDHPDGNEEQAGRPHGRAEPATRKDAEA